MSGPPPKDPATRRRRNATPGFKLLPREGRSGPTPAFPLPNSTQFELATWKDLWTLPQAVEWERMRCEPTVALYVRAFALAADSGDVKMLGEVRQLDNKIGLSPLAMRNLRWETDEALDEEEIPDAAPAEAEEPKERSYVPKAPGAA